MRRETRLVPGAIALTAAATVLSAAGIARAQSTGGDIDPVTGRPMGPIATHTNPSPAPAASEPGPEHRYGHLHQVELRVGAAEGYRLAVRYDTPSTPCDPGGNHFCHDRSPVVIDTALGFGVTDSVEIEARFRTGEFDFNDSLPLAAGLGVRVYSSDFLQFKWVFGAAVLADFTAAGNQPTWQTDVLARVEGGIHYDVVREFGFYLQVGATIGFLRSLAFTIDGGAGLQLRLP